MMRSPWRLPAVLVPTLLLLVVTTIPTTTAQQMLSDRLPTATSSITLPDNIQHVYQIPLGKYYETTLARPGDKLALRACAGLFNRDDHLRQGGSAVFLLEPLEEVEWYNDITVELNVSDLLYNGGNETMREAILLDPLLVNTTVISVEDFLPICLQHRDASRGYISYSFEQQQAILPNIMTLAGLLDAIPIDIGSLKGSLVQSEKAPALSNVDLDNVPLVLDAVELFDGQTPVQVTAYMFDNYARQTTGLAKLNPGYQRSDNTVDPILEPGNVRDLGTSDFVVQQKIFAFYLYDACNPDTAEGRLWNRMTSNENSPWPVPIAIYGYDHTYNVFGGYLFEASTHCGRTHFNTGSIPSDNFVNLSFYMRWKRNATPVQTAGGKVPIPGRTTSNGEFITPATSQAWVNQLSPQDLPPKYTPEKLTYDPTKTYLAFAMGDGDNVLMVKNDRREWIKERTQHCGVQSTTPVFGLADTGTDQGPRPVNRQGDCLPLLWTMSPHLERLAPDMYQWFQNQAQLATNGKDSFMLPPSGHLYGFPGMMNEANQREFVRLTEMDAKRMGTNAVVAWEFAGTWDQAMTQYFPKYLDNGIITAAFAVNVPYLVPIVSYPFTDTYRILSRTNPQTGVTNKLAVFESFIWRGTDDANDTQMSVQNMAQAINSYPRGIVNSVYTSSDNGFSIASLHELTPLLADHVVLVNSEQLADLAFQRGDSNPSVIDGLLDSATDIPELIGDVIGQVFPSSMRANRASVNLDDLDFGF